MIILDSSFIIAHKVDDDEHHESAVELMSKIAAGEYGDVVISDYIFDEVTTVVFGRTKSLSEAVDVGSRLFFGEIVEIDKGIFQSAWEIFKEQKDTKFSFTDCSILAVMKEKGIKNIATFDGDFEGVEGIEVVK
jgi:uncharacterized protein